MTRARPRLVGSPPAMRRVSSRRSFGPPHSVLRVLRASRYRSATLKPNGGAHRQRRTGVEQLERVFADMGDSRGLLWTPTTHPYGALARHHSDLVRRSCGCRLTNSANRCRSPGRSNLICRAPSERVGACSSFRRGAGPIAGSPLGFAGTLRRKIVAEEVRNRHPPDRRRCAPRAPAAASHQPRRPPQILGVSGTLIFQSRSTCARGGDRRGRRGRARVRVQKAMISTGADAPDRADPRGTEVGEVVSRQLRKRII